MRSTICALNPKHLTNAFIIFSYSSYGRVSFLFQLFCNMTNKNYI